jgi:hypothetical protein
VVAGHGQDPGPERAQERCRALVVDRPSAVGQVSARNHDLGLHALDQALQRLDDLGRLARADMQV